MTVRRYCTPEWLADAAQAYSRNPAYQKEFEKMTLKLSFRITAVPEWGIDNDIYFCCQMDRGSLVTLSFISPSDATQSSDYILSATPQEWKKILRKENKFITDFILGKIVLDQGSKVGVMGVAPHSNTLIDILTQSDLQFPDEMSPEELERYRQYLREFRRAMNV